MKVRAWPMLLAIGLAFASSAQDAAAPQRALLDLYVNEVKQETVLVLLPEDGDALVPVQELIKAGLRGFGGRRQMYEGVELVSVRSLAPLVVLRLDLDALAVRVDAHPSLLGAMSFDLRPNGRPKDLVLRADTSGFLNYSVTGTSGAGLGLAAELGATLGTNLAYTGVSRAPGGAVVRGLSNVVMDDPASLRRTTLGDAFLGGGALGGSALIAGVAVAREFSLDPYFVRTPMPRLQGAVLTPSTLDVYVNGQLVRSVPVAPGSFEVQNVPVSGGAGTYSYVVRDAFGRTQEYAAPYYASAGLLSKGISEYAYGVGLRRREFGISSFSYGPPALSASHRLGLTDGITAGLRFESAVQGIKGWDEPACSTCASLLASGGASIVAGLPFGELSAEIAGSADGTRGGAAALLAYSFATPRLSAGASARAMTPAYANLALSSSADRPRLGVHGFAGTQLSSFLSAGVDYDLSAMRDAGLSSKLGLRLDTRVGRQATLSAAVARIRDAGQAPMWAFTAGLLYTFGERTLAHAGGTAGSAGTGAEMGLQRSIPVGEGVGYQLRSSLEPGGAGAGTGFVQAQHAHGIASGTYSRYGAEDSGSVTAAGAIVAVGGQVYASRPVQQGYALVQVPGVEGVRTYLNNQEVGRTNGGGNVLVPDLQPYYGNRLSISPEDLPLEYVVARPEETVATAHRGGAFVKFDAHRIQAVTGTVKVRDGVPAYGELTVSGPAAFAQTSPIGARGEFFLERMEPGRYHAAIEFKEGTCAFELDVPVAPGAQVDLGALVCFRLQPAATAAE